MAVSAAVIMVLRSIMAGLEQKLRRCRFDSASIAQRANGRRSTSRYGSDKCLTQRNDEVGAFAGFPP